MKLILPILCSVLLIGCGDSSQTSTSADSAKIAEPKNTKVAAVSETTVYESVAPSTEQKATSLVQPVSQTVTPEPISKKSTAPDKIKTVAKTPVPVSAKLVETAAVDGKTLYDQKCSSCHGSKAEKSALNKSQIIADFNEQQLKDALHGYQTGSYGKEMKGLMQGQVKSFNSEQINALAKHISTL